MIDNNDKNCKRNRDSCHLEWGKKGKRRIYHKKSECVCACMCEQVRACVGKCMAVLVCMSMCACVEKEEMSGGLF